VYQIIITNGRDKANIKAMIALLEKLRLMPAEFVTIL
jgi:hypothetical protein